MSQRSIVVAFVIVLAGCPCSLLAQRGGGRGGRGSTGGGASGGPAETQEMKDFKLGAAVQANERQVALFQALAKDAEVARSQAGELVRLGKTTPDQFTILGAAIETARDESKNFLSSLSEQQKSGLKGFRKNVEKADSDVGKNWEALNQQFGRTNKGDQQIAAEMAKLEKALAKFVTEQWDLGDKMGIQPPPHEGDNAGDK